MIKLGSVPFINVKPLTYALEKQLIKHEFEFVYAPPAELSVMMSERTIDLGLLPVAELLKKPSYRLFPDISISSFGKVDSVTLVSKVPIDNIATVMVDRRSQSSAGLLKVILELFKGLKPEYVKSDVLSLEFEGFDSIMLIGDAGLRCMYDPPSDMILYDLGELWTDETGLPFVYGIYAVNEGVDLGAGAQILHDSKKAGLTMIDKIVMERRRDIGISVEACKRYLEERIRYDLGDKEVQAINLYATLMRDVGELDRVPPELNFYESPLK